MPAKRLKTSKKIKKAASTTKKNVKSPVQKVKKALAEGALSKLKMDDAEIVEHIIEGIVKREIGTDLIPKKFLGLVSQGFRDKDPIFPDAEAIDESDLEALRSWRDTEAQCKISLADSVQRYLILEKQVEAMEAEMDQLKERMDAGSIDLQSATTSIRQLMEILSVKFGIPAHGSVQIDNGAITRESSE